MLHRLRPADTSDFEWLFALERTSYRHYVEQVFGAWDEAEQRARFTRSFATQPLSVVEVDGEAAGVLSVAWDEDPVALHDIELQPRWQGRGLGTRLVHDVLREAAGQGRAVALQILRPNPVRALYERLGFVVVGQTDSHVQMRWEADAEPALEAAMSPWRDVQRRRVWAQRLFEAPSGPHADFARFVAGRHGLGDDLDVLTVMGGSTRALRELAGSGWRVTAYEPDPDHHAAAARAAAAAGPSVAAVHGGLDQLPSTSSYGLILAFGGVLWRIVEHEARVDAIRRVAAALRPGGVLVVEGPNMPWVLRSYREPVPRTEVYHRASVSRIPEHRLDFHDGVLEHRDTFVVEADGEVLAEWDERRRYAMVGLPQIRLALQQGGLGCIETFRDLDATGPARAMGPRVVLTARTGP